MNSVLKKYFYLFSVFLYVSCGINDLDLDQIKDYSTTRVFKTSLAYFTVDQKDFLDASGLEINVPVGEEAGFLFFINNASLRFNLEKIEIEIEINNQFSRDFEGKIQFLDANNNITQDFKDIKIKAKNSSHKQTLSLTIANNVHFLNSTKVRFEIKLKPSTNGSVLNTNVKETLNFKSVGIYYITGEYK